MVQTEFKLNTGATSTSFAHPDRFRFMPPDKPLTLQQSPPSLWDHGSVSTMSSMSRESDL